ncbi:MAG: extradiol dioxygenase [Fimbriimonas ginsengisoli]|uniref:Extradiol dioxygenase n=1 Tax=Fimbriimonas ginsengisoli TaxID=1005039 RepID=A0A931LTU0_FIMGI|nr:extradiol dioxygenase [Fimbriimonas ginsengisoli]
MITGAHFLLYSSEPERDRAFLRDVLRFRSVDIGDGWLIFALPASELAVHPADDNFVQRHADHNLAGHILYLMTDDLHAEIELLRAQGVECGELGSAEWGSWTTLPLPSGAEIGLYEPTHETAI